ncbi:MAG: PEP-CTERM sorting domain-containing protein [Chthoniobacterales bacterium]
MKKQHGMRFTLVITMIAALAGILSSSTAKAQLVYGDAGQIYVTSNNTIKWYNQDGSGGTTVSLGGPNGPTGLALASSNTLLVANNGSTYISRYPTTNAYVQSGSAHPYDIAVNGSTLWVTWNTINLVERYTMTGTGAGQYTYAGGTSLNLSDPRGIAIDAAGNVYMANYGNGTINKYTAAFLDGGVVLTGLTDPEGLAIDSLGNMYVSSLSGGYVSKYSTSGTLISLNFITGLSSPSALALDGAGNLFVANSGTGIVGKYDAATGAPINASFITGVSGLTAITVSTPIPVPEPSSVALLCIGGLAFLAWRNRRTFRAMR